MPKMTQAQRIAILKAHNTWNPAHPIDSRGMVDAYERTHCVLQRNGWTNGIRVTRAGLIAAGADMDAIHAEALDENRTRRGFEMTAGMAAILRSATPMTGFITVYVGDEEDDMIRAGLIRRDEDSDYFILEAGVQMLKNWEALHGAPGDLPNPTQTIRVVDHAQAIAEDVRHIVATVARNAGSSPALAAVERLRDTAHAEALTEDDARSVAEGRKLLGWDETPAERDRRMTAEFIEAMNTEYARTGVAGALADVAAVWRTINAPEGFRPADVRPLLDRIEAALRRELQ
jgi:hypothetical protein